MLQDSAVANQFVDRLMDEKGLQSLDPDIRAQMRQDLLRRLGDQINRAIINALSAHQAAQLEHLIDTNQVDKIQKFLYDQGINVNGIIASAMSDFHASYLEA